MPHSSTVLLLVHCNRPSLLPQPTHDIICQHCLQTLSSLVVHTVCVSSEFPVIGATVHWDIPLTTCLLHLPINILRTLRIISASTICAYIFHLQKVHSKYYWIRCSSFSSRIGVAREFHSNLTLAEHSSPEGHEVIVMSFRNPTLFAACIQIWLTYVWAFLYIFTNLLIIY